MNAVEKALQHQREDPRDSIKNLLTRIRNNPTDTEACALLAFAINKDTSPSLFENAGIELLLDIISRTQVTPAEPTRLSYYLSAPLAQRLYARTTLKLAVASGGFNVASSHENAMRIARFFSSEMLEFKEDPQVVEDCCTVLGILAVESRAVQNLLFDLDFPDVLVPVVGYTQITAANKEMVVAACMLMSVLIAAAASDLPRRAKQLSAFRVEVCVPYLLRALSIFLENIPTRRACCQALAVFANSYGRTHAQELIAKSGGVELLSNIEDAYKNDEISHKAAEQLMTAIRERVFGYDHTSVFVRRWLGPLDLMSFHEAEWLRKDRELKDAAQITFTPKNYVKITPSSFDVRIGRLAANKPATCTLFRTERPTGSLNLRNDSRHRIFFEARVEVGDDANNPTVLAYVNPSRGEIQKEKSVHLRIILSFLRVTDLRAVLRIDYRCANKHSNQTMTCLVRLCASMAPLEETVPGLTLIEPGEIKRGTCISDGSSEFNEDRTGFSVELRDVFVYMKEFGLSISPISNMAALYREISILNDLRHENIVKLLGVCVSYRAILLPLYPNRDLTHYMTALVPIERLSILRQMLNALQYLREVGVEHNSLCPSHILVECLERTSSINPQGGSEGETGGGRSGGARSGSFTKVVLTSFSKATRVSEPPTPWKASSWEEFRWISPEEFKHAQAAHNSDTFRFGMLLWALINPFLDAFHAKELVQHASSSSSGVPSLTHQPSSSFPEAFSPKVLPLLHSICLACWEESEMSRPSYKDLSEIFQYFLNVESVTNRTVYANQPGFHGTEYSNVPVEDLDIDYTSLPAINWFREKIPEAELILERFYGDYLPPPYLQRFARKDPPKSSAIEVEGPVSPPRHSRTSPSSHPPPYIPQAIIVNTGESSIESSGVTTIDDSSSLSSVSSSSSSVVTSTADSSSPPRRFRSNAMIAHAIPGSSSSSSSPSSTSSSSLAGGSSNPAFSSTSSRDYTPREVANFLQFAGLSLDTATNYEQALKSLAVENVPDLAHSIGAEDEPSGLDTFSRYRLKRMIDAQIKNKNIKLTIDNTQ